MANAVLEIEKSKILVSQLISDETLSSLIDEANGISEKFSVPLNITSPVYNIRSYFDKGEIDVGSFTKELATKVSNKITADMKLRFSPGNMNVLTGIDALNPKSEKFVNEKIMCQLVDHYEADNVCINKTLLQTDVSKHKIQTSLPLPSTSDNVGINNSINP